MLGVEIELRKIGVWLNVPQKSLGNKKAQEELELELRLALYGEEEDSTSQVHRKKIAQKK
jgi:hypothetical protein